jgi:hypothetical protein
MKVYGGAGVTFLTLALQLEMSGQLHAPAALPPGKNPRHPLKRKLGVPGCG